MAEYRFKCDNCNTEFFLERKMKDRNQPATCTQCHFPARKILNLFAPHVKASVARSTYKESAKTQPTGGAIRLENVEKAEIQASFINCGVGVRANNANITADVSFKNVDKPFDLTNSKLTAKIQATRDKE